MFLSIPEYSDWFEQSFEKRTELKEAGEPHWWLVDPRSCTSIPSSQAPYFHLAECSHVNKNNFFTIFLQHKNGNIANFILTMPFKLKTIDKVCKVIPFYQLISNLTFTDILRYK